MIAHLRGRERKLEPLGWTGQDAEWITLVCLHSGVFTRAQFCQYFDTDSKRAHRFVKSLLDRRAAHDGEWPILNGGAKTCRISSKAVYRALGVENIRHRRKATNPVVMRRLLSLDFVLEHPGMNWLPDEPEKVEFFEELGLPLRLLPRRIYYGVVGNQKRYFALKLPLAVDPETVTFAYVDPGHQTDRELYSWGAAHGPLWDALRKKGRQVRVLGIAAENLILDRTRRVLERWAAAEPGTSDEGLTVKQEIKAIDDAMTRNDDNFLARYGGFGKAARRSAELQGWAADPGTSDEVLTAKQEIKAIDDAMTHNDDNFLARYGGFAKAGRRFVELQRGAAADPGTSDEGLTVKQEIKAIDDAMTRKDREFLARYGGFGQAARRSVELMRLPEAKLTEGVSIDDYSTYRATRFADPNEIG